jgi:hypothetical protein
MGGSIGSGRGPRVRPADVKAIFDAVETSQGLLDAFFQVSPTTRSCDESTVPLRRWGQSERGFPLMSRPRSAPSASEATLAPPS